MLCRTSTMYRAGAPHSLDQKTSSHHSFYAASSQLFLLYSYLVSHSFSRSVSFLVKLFSQILSQLSGQLFAALFSRLRTEVPQPDRPHQPTYASSFLGLLPVTHHTGFPLQRRRSPLFGLCKGIVSLGYRDCLLSRVYNCFGVGFPP